VSETEREREREERERERERETMPREGDRWSAGGEFDGCLEGVVVLGI
jgi:hypothetical protein